MKRIIEVCTKHAPRGIQNDIVKLRLRGKGSGFKEGAKQEESSEPLHLCISSRFYEKYVQACSMAQELLLNVYEEYKKHCEKSKRDMRVTSIADPSAIVLNGLLQIRKTESITGRRPQIQPLPNTYHVNP